MATAGDIVVEGGNCYLETDHNVWSCPLDGQRRAAFRNVTLGGGGHVSVYLVRSLRVAAGTRLELRGPAPVVVIALDRVEVLGTIVAQPGQLGGAVPPDTNGVGGGPGGGAAGTSTGELRAGGGGSFCGTGGAGALSGDGAPSAGASAYGAAELTPLVAGSSGGSGAIAGFRGRGGGALQIVAGREIVVAAGGGISMPGAGGGPGGIAAGQEAGGGGSGGAILLEAPSVRIAGTLAANGGAGGQGGPGESGEDGHADGTPARGGIGVGLAGGTGSAGDTANGAAGTGAPGRTVGGGGGGAGRIRIHTQTGAPDVTGTLSPSVASQCASFGTLAAR